jgi:hypothetical protein
MLRRWLRGGYSRSSLSGSSPWIGRITLLCCTSTSSSRSLTSLTIPHSINPLPHQLSVTISHASPAYLDEEYPITLSIANTDRRPLFIDVDVLLQPTEIDTAINYIVCGEERSTSMIKGISYARLEPGGRGEKTILLINTGGEGGRTVDISIRSRLTEVVEVPASPDEVVDVTETLRTLVVPVVSPLKLVHNVTYHRSLSETPGLMDLRTFDGDFWDNTDGGEAVIASTVECVGPWKVEVEKMSLKRREGRYAKVLSCTCDGAGEEEFPAELAPKEDWAMSCVVAMSVDVEEEQLEPIRSPGEYEVVWRRYVPRPPQSIHMF